MASLYHINPRIRAYGKARIDITRRARSETEWQELWREPLNSLPFDFDRGWKFSFEYTVADFAAEVGFYIDILGFPVRAFSPVFAQFSLPGDEFGFNVSAAQEGQEDTNPNTIRIQLSVKNIEKVAQALEDRGIVFEQPPTPIHAESPMISANFRSPHGVCIELIGETSTQAEQDHGTDSFNVPVEKNPSLDELLGLPDEDDQEIGDEGEIYPEDDERGGAQETVLEPEYVDEISDEDLELAPGDPPAAIASLDAHRQNARVASTDKSGGGYSPRSVPMNTLRQSQNLAREGSMRWPANNDKRSGRSVYDETEVDEL